MEYVVKTPGRGEATTMRPPSVALHTPQPREAWAHLPRTTTRHPVGGNCHPTRRAVFYQCKWWSIRKETDEGSLIGPGLKSFKKARPELLGGEAGTGRSGSWCLLVLQAFALEGSPRHISRVPTFVWHKNRSLS